MVLIDLQRLEKLAQLNANPEWVNRDLYRLLFKPDLYLAAYERIKSRPGNMTPGTDGSTLDGFSKAAIDTIVSAMRDESYTFSPARRVLIPKASGKMRPLGIANPREKIVQEAIRMILEAIYDSPYGPSFSEWSFGFRRGRGTHSALKEIRTHWTGVRWLVEGDFESFFDTIDHETLVAILRKRIQDERFLNLIRKALKAGVLHDGAFVPSLFGTPQGSILSPCLANAYLHELDRKVEEIIERENKGREPRTNPPYRAIQTKLGKLRAATTIDLTEIRRLKRERRAFPKFLQRDPNYIRVHYVRYADDWLVGVIGPKRLAETIRAEIASFVSEELKLKLNLDKTHIRHATTEEASFLGTLISCKGSRENDLVLQKSRTGGRPIKRRKPRGRVRMKAPVDQIVRRLYLNGFCDVEGYPVSKKSWTILDDDQIIARFNQILDGILNYYSFVDNISRLHRVQYILHFSAAKTLSHKHRIQSLRKTFQKYGRNLTVKVPRVSGPPLKVSLKLRRDWTVQTLNFRGLTANLHIGSLGIVRWRLQTASSLGKPCAVCGVTDQIEMHHLRHIRKIGVKLKGFARLMASLNRKQIPVCRKCHEDIHQGRYDGMSLKQIAESIALVGNPSSLESRVR